MDSKSVRISDAKLIELIRLGLIVYRDGEVYKFLGRRFVVLKRHRYDREVERYRYFLRWRGARRTISSARLVWMITRRACPPEDYHIDHIDRDPANDDPMNLRPIKREVNSALGYDSRVERVCDFFRRKLAAQYGSLGDF